GPREVRVDAPELYVNTPNDNMKTMEQTVQVHGSIIAYGAGNAVDRFSVKLNKQKLEVVPKAQHSGTTTNQITTVSDRGKLVFDGRIKLEPGVNTLTIQGWDRNNKACQKTLTLNKKARLGDIYALVVGISQFANAEYNLKYAASDARRFSRFLKSEAGGGLSESRVRLVTNDQATRARIIQRMTQFLGQAFHDDTVEIYMATHGMVGPKGNLYYLCWDTRTDNLKGTGFSDEDLTSILNENINAGKVIIYIDACHSGLSGLSKQRFARRSIVVNEVNKQINSLATGLSKVAETGVATLSATSASGFSLEGERWSGGIFTQCLIDGLQGKANRDGDEWVTIQEIDVYLTQKILDLTNGKQKPRIRSTLPDEVTPLSRVK
ncbi:MAG TPA: caspase family protein, partial [Desulfohalobiaceae bacterium]|nr:caspase family protein [Desulfohalobiaceae bacterium]